MFLFDNGSNVRNGNGNIERWKMTREEAIKQLEDLDNCYNQLSDNDREAKNMAIKALEAWDKVIKEINKKSKIGGVIYTQDVREIINKYLGEVEE